MPITILRGDEAPIEPLRTRTVAVVGYGNQGRAHALNLRDSGIEVVVGTRSNGAGHTRAIADGFEPRTIDEATAAADLVIIALPDETHAEVYAASIAPNLRDGACVGFLHGFTLRYELVRPADGVGVILVAPKGPGTTLRARFQSGQGIPCLFAVGGETAAGDTEAVGLAWAAGIGCARAAIVRTTIAEETETDLFGEQAVLCGGLTWLILAAFETLVEAGYAPEVAYVETCHEVKQVADLVYERGIAGMMEAISTTAEFGAHHAGPRVVDDAVRARLREILADVRSGAFSDAMMSDHRNGSTWFESKRAALESHPIESAGRVARSLMPWLGNRDEDPGQPAPGDPR